MAEQEVALISLKDNGKGKSVQEHQDAEPIIGGVPLPFSYFSHVDVAPDWNAVDRDSWLRSFWKKAGQDMLQAVLAVSVAKVQTQNWVIEGPEKMAEFYHSALRDDADFGKGFGYMVARGVIDYYTQDNGWFIERMRASASDHSGPCLGFAHLDSSRMKPTGNAEQPYAYMDVHGKFHLMHRSQLIRIVDMPTPEVQLHGDERGFCALSRALSTAMILGMLVAMKREKLADLPPSALAIFNNINKKQFDSALNLHAMQEEAKGNIVWRNVMPLFGIDPAHPAALDFVSLREVWEGFDEMTAYNVAAYSFAAAWRIDPREFWPVSQGPLGTGKEADIQHQKAKAKSTGLLFTEIERAFNHKDTLPKELTFKFEIQDSEEEEIQARIHGMQVANIKSMQEAGAELSTEEVRFMLSRVYKVLPQDLEVPVAEDDVFVIDKTDVWIDDVERHTKEYWGPSVVIDSRGETVYLQEGFKGSATSGNWGHGGRPGKRGGSSARGGLTIPSPNPSKSDMDAFMSKKGSALLYHATVADAETLDSIIDKGLVPSYQAAPGQTWQAEHSPYATYFHSSSYGAEGEMRNADEMGSPTALLITTMPRTKENARKVLPDEDASTNPDHGLKELNDGGPVAVIGGLPANSIQGIILSKEAANDNAIVDKMWDWMDKGITIEFSEDITDWQERMGEKEMFGLKQRYQIPDTIPKGSGGFAAYARQVRANTRGLWSGQIEYLDYLDSMRFTIQNGLRRAWMDGRREGGLTGDLGDEEKVKLSELVTNEIIFSAQFADAIEKDSKANGGKLANVLNRAEMWSLSYKQAANWALLFSGERLEWKRGPTKQPCTDALRLDGRVYNAKVWKEWGVVPQSRELECGGWRCACSLTVTDKPVTKGRPPKLEGQKGD